MPDNFTIKYITSYDECASSVNDFCGDPVFSDPMLSNAGQIRLSLINAIEGKEHPAEKVTQENCWRKFWKCS